MAPEPPQHQAAVEAVQHGYARIFHCYTHIQTGFWSVIMATHERGGVTLVTAVEELAGGRYRGFLTIDSESGLWRYDCQKCHATPLEARAEADADLEYAYRWYLAMRLADKSPGRLPLTANLGICVWAGHGSTSPPRQATVRTSCHSGSV